MSIPNQVMQKLSIDEEIVYQFERPFSLKSPGLVFTNKRLIYYKPKSSGLKLEQYSWRDVDKISIKEGLITDEIEFEVRGDHEIELEDISRIDVREMYAIAMELKENAYDNRDRATAFSGSSRPMPSSPLPSSRQMVQKRHGTGFMARMWTVVQDKVNRMMGMEDPRENLDLSFEKQQIMLEDVRRSVTQFAVYRERIELQREKLQLSMERLEAQARESLSANREDLARTALEKRAVFQAQADSLDRQIADLKEQHQKLMAAESRLAAKLEAFQARKEGLKAEYSAAEAQVRLAESLTGISEEMADVGLAVELAEERTLHMKARSAALDEMLQSGASTDLSADGGREHEIAVLKAGSCAEDELDRIKAEMRKGKN